MLFNIIRVTIYKKITIYDISGEQIIFKINDKFEKEKLTEILEEAVTNEYSYFDYSYNTKLLYHNMPSNGTDSVPQAHHWFC